MPHLRSLKLYNYPMGYSPDDGPAAAHTHIQQDGDADRAAAGGGSRQSVQGREGKGRGGGGGVAVAVHALRSSLCSLRLHDCISIHGCTCGAQAADVSVGPEAAGGPSGRESAAGCYGCRCGELVDALRSCGQLQHLGLRFTTATSPTPASQPSHEATRATEGSHNSRTSSAGGRATPGPQPAFLPLLLSQLTHLRSLKLQAQSQLPPDLALSSGLGDSLAHLPAWCWAPGWASPPSRPCCSNRQPPRPCRTCVTWTPPAAV